MEWTLDVEGGRDGRTGGMGAVLMKLTRMMGRQKRRKNNKQKSSFNSLLFACRNSATQRVTD